MMSLAKEIMQFGDLSKYTDEVFGAYTAYQESNWSEFGRHWGKLAAEITKVHVQKME